MKAIRLGSFVLSLVVIVNTVSCRGRSYDYINDLSVQENYVSVTDDNRIFGEWQVCSIMKADYSIQMNICPEIVFRKEGEGFVRNASGSIEGFTWKLGNGKLLIKSASNSQDRMFSDSVYSVDIKYEKGLYNSVINAMSANETFYLGR
jgi:hypothetical protein